MKVNATVCCISYACSVNDYNLRTIFKMAWSRLMRQNLVSRRVRHMNTEDGSQISYTGNLLTWRRHTFHPHVYLLLFIIIIYYGYSFNSFLQSCYLLLLNARIPNAWTFSYRPSMKLMLSSANDGLVIAWVSAGQKYDIINVCYPNSNIWIHMSFTRNDPNSNTWCLPCLVEIPGVQHDY